MHIYNKFFSLGFLLVSITLLLVLPGLALAANLLSSGATFDQFESYNGKTWQGYPEEKGKGWTVLGEPMNDRPHFLNSEVFGHFAEDLYHVPYLNYRIEGSHSQVFASRRAFNIVFSQTVTVNSGQDYALGGKIVTFWKGSGGERDDNKIFKRIGIDPTGGVNYNSSNVVWTTWEGIDNVWTDPALAVTAQANKVTVFIQVENKGADVGPAYLNSGHLDNFRFELAPMATLNLPASAVPGPLTVTWNATLPDESYWDLWGYDVEYKDNLTNAWQAVQSHNNNNGKNTSYTFNAQAGRIYTFRVRPWQERPGGDAATTALPGVWQEESVTLGQAVVGQVMNHLGLNLGGVTVSVVGGNSSASDLYGQYQLPTGGPGDFNVAAGDIPGFQAPPTTTVTISGSSIVNLPLTFHPAGEAQALRNNHFETDLAFWQESNPGNVSVAAAARHTGERGLRLENNAQISQTNTVSNLRNPTLSFWYKNDTALEVQFLAEAGQTVEPLLTRTLQPVNEWTFVVLELNGPEFYSGEIGVNFVTSGGTIYIDEVGIAAGAYEMYTPLILKD